MSKQKLIFVTGDPICDHNLYKGSRHTADSLETRGVLARQTGGGALLLKNLIAETMREEPEWTTEFGLVEDFRSLPPAYHSYCLWEPQVGNPAEAPGNQVQYWRAVEPPLGYGHSKVGLAADFATKLRDDAYPPNPSAAALVPDIGVIDDAGTGFRDPSRRNLWRLGGESNTQSCPRWVVLKLTGSIGNNPLWDSITQQCRDNLVVIVPAEELRRRNVKIRPVSWEATVEDLTAELRDSPLLRPLLKARHLVVTFQCDAAYWLDNVPHSPGALLVFDAARAEGEWSASQGKGGAFGFLSCFTAAIVRELCLTQNGSEPDLETACGAGLNASRELRQLGHGRVVVNGNEPDPGFPFVEIATGIRQPVGKFVSAQIPLSGRERDNWMMLDEWQVHARNTHKPRPYFDHALAVAVLGPEALERLPVARFVNYETVDRKEIESLHRIQDFMTTYQRAVRPRTPLNLGVFAPPGAGKLFVVTQVAKAALSLGNEDDILTFNLSQFDGPADLIGAFHQIRDKVISGITPLVFWDEFDSQGYKWLPYLLAPMQDGKFQEGQSTHPIGKCIFVFSTATSLTYDKFGPPNPDLLSGKELEQLKKLNLDQLREMERTWREFVLKKGPEFKSQLVGNLTVLGVNPRQICIEKDGRRCWVDDKRDLCYPIRRALFIRSQFKVKKGERLRLDLSILRALLEIPIYKSGGRSLHALCTDLGEKSNGTDGRSSLPEFDFLNVHVDAAKFRQICEQDMEFVPKAKELATLLHAQYKTHIKGSPSKNFLEVPFDMLPNDFQDANVARAHRIPFILRLVGLRLEPGPVVPLEELGFARNASEEPIRRLLAEKDNLELLAEAAHNSWMVERMLNGWKYGRKKDEAKRLHECLIPYSQLPEEIKNYTRWEIIGRCTPERKHDEKEFGYVDLVKIVGLRVVMDEKLAVEPPLTESRGAKPRSAAPKAKKVAGEQRKDVFISYRREGGAATARLIKAELEKRGVSVFLDVVDLGPSHFDSRLLTEIERAPNFVLILSRDALDRCTNEGDWLRQEIAHALKVQRRIVPILESGFAFPPKADLPTDIAELPRHQAVALNFDYFDAVMVKVMGFLQLRQRPARTLSQPDTEDYGRQGEAL